MEVSVYWNTQDLSRPVQELLYLYIYLHLYLVWYGVTIGTPASSTFWLED